MFARCSAGFGVHHRWADANASSNPPSSSDRSARTTICRMPSENPSVNLSVISSSTDPDQRSAKSDVQRDGDRLRSLEHIIDHAAHFLPAQGPIEVFVHHNTLHAFEHRPFHEAVRLAHDIYGAHPYLRESEYREMLETGRVRIADLKAVLRDDLPGSDSDPIDGVGTRLDLRLSMLLHPLRTGSEAELQWVIAETDALCCFRPEISSLVRERVLDETEQYVQSYAGGEHQQGTNDALESLLESAGEPTFEGWREQRWEEFTLQYLWRVCEQGVRANRDTQCSVDRPVRVRDALLAATGEDTDQYVHEILIRFCAAFLDQGYADWELPEFDAGFFRSFVGLYGTANIFGERWMRSVHRELRKLTHAQTTPLESVDESLELLGVPLNDRAEFVTKSLLALAGWAGMIWQLESAADWVDRPAPKGSLLEFLAIRLVLDRVAAEFVARQFLGCEGPLNHVTEAAWKKSPRTKDDRFQQTFQVFQIAQSMGWTPQVLQQMSETDWSNLADEIASFDELQRRRIFHEAYERKYRIATLNAVAIHFGRRRDEPPAQDRRSFQIVCCIDDREESFRRHLEEIDPNCETFGAAGFFAVAMNYQGAADANYKPLCPVIIDPQHYVKEDVGYTFGGEHRRRAETRRALGRFTHQVHARSRTLAGGIVTALFGSLAAFPLVARVLFPHLTAQIRRRFGQFVQPPPVTQLQLERYQSDPGPEGGHVGYSVEEMVDLVERLLRDIGLTDNFARLIVITGHGSSSVNNPHESAYNCGACAGKRGGPNARAFAHMANDWRVRARLIERGIRVPIDSAFVGAYHNTCDDSVVWYDLDRLPPSHRIGFEKTKQHVDQAQLRNAHERARRFRSASLNVTPAEAKRHVEQRSEDLSQVRPEYNHATDALCFVGRREWSRGLFLDRRAFLTSYDPAQDDEQSSILLRILSAAIPVCAGINLEYYFSRVDNVKYGSGSKLPHNIVSLLGVMEGATSDLRTGLYQQMVEIHEPMRLLFVIETTAEAMLRIMDQHDDIGRLCRGEWIQLAILDGETGALQIYGNGKFSHYEPTTRELPTSNSSRAWYGGKRDHLGFTSIRETPPCNADLTWAAPLISSADSTMSVSADGCVEGQTR